MRGALGNHGATREASGTAWQPDLSEHSGWMMKAGDWDIMVHGNLDLIADTQSGRRGDDKLFAAGMLMGMATRQFDNGNALQLRGMVSPDPLMGKSGYPLLLASGETANGTDRLIDRQHPHDFFMELSASYSVKLADKASAFLYAGLPGEPAFGPPAFMHRQSISASPEAPISHHWLDSTHITFGVVTGGLVLDRVKVEASRFNGREPDEKRYNIETGPLDSTVGPPVVEPDRSLCRFRAAGRISRIPSNSSPGVNQRRLVGLGALYAADGQRLVGDDPRVGSQNHRWRATMTPSRWKARSNAMTGRCSAAAKSTENNELVETCRGGRGRITARRSRSAKVSLGLVRDFRSPSISRSGVGGLYSLNFVPKGLKEEYGTRTPHGAMGFVRLKIPVSAAGRVVLAARPVRP